MSLDDLADALLELRRYVRDKPEFAAEEVGRLEDAIREMSGCEIPRLWADRLETNLSAGRNRIHSNPEMLRGYLFGAAQEIREHARRGGGE